MLSLEVHLLPQLPYGVTLRRVWEQVARRGERNRAIVAGRERTPAVVPGGGTRGVASAPVRAEPPVRQPRLPRWPTLFRRN